MKKKQVVLVVLVVLILFFIVFWQDDAGKNILDDTLLQERVVLDLKTYEDDRVGIRFHYPSDWKLDRQGQGVDLTFNPEEYGIDDIPITIVFRIENNSRKQDVAIWLNNLDISSEYSYKKRYTQCLSLNDEIPEVCGLYAEKAYTLLNKDGLDFYTAGEGGSSRYVMIPHHDSMLIFALGSVVSENLSEPQSPELKKLITSFEDMVSSTELIVE